MVFSFFCKRLTLIILHELGHNRGLECGENTIPYNLMNAGGMLSPRGHDVHSTEENQAYHFRNNNPYPTEQR